ncbi:MAG: hypothetical protein JXR78_14660 [Victivallales bacterium]|nr:hypothetical protein [Victivallales bacterium]
MSKPVNVVFLGGGSLRILPIVRGLFRILGLFDGGSIRLVDLKVERAEAVGTLIKRCPEFKNVNCQVMWTNDLDRALDGADLFYLTTAVEREPSNTLALKASVEAGYLHSDQLSINGAFLAARAGGMVMNFARKMEKYCPDAMMLIFANPVAVFSAAVSNYTKIKALGICAGFCNHRWDLPRICGRDSYEEDWNVVAAGVNHLSFIIRGEYQGRDFNEVLADSLTPDWKPMPITSYNCQERIQEGLQKLVDVYRRFGSMIFSSEGDGMSHVLWQWGLDKNREQLSERLRSFDPVHTAAAEAQAMEDRFASYISAAHASQEPDWHTPLGQDNPFAADVNEISIPIIKALAGLEPMRITASYPNRGAVSGIPDNYALEYTMELFENNITPAENMFIPQPFHGLIASLSEHQTLLADAIAQKSGKLFADALEAYPMNRFDEKRIPFFKQMFGIFSDLAPELKEAENYLSW